MSFSSPPRPLDIIVFGATGFTGRLICRALSHRSKELRCALQCGVAGRSRLKLEALGFEGRIFVLPDAADVAAYRVAVKTCRVAIGAAGPFTKVGSSLVEACVKEGTHYVDITGEVTWVRDWLGIEAPVSRPAVEHPKRPVKGFACERSEVSGSRVWGGLRDHFKRPERFFADHYIANYCPLVFIEESGRNRTPDKLPTREREPLFDACDRHLRRLVAVLEPEWVIGIGAFAEGRIAGVIDGAGAPRSPKIGRILHPSPANPRAQKDWAGQARRELEALGVCPSAARRGAAKAGFRQRKSKR